MFRFPAKRLLKNSMKSKERPWALTKEGPIHEVKKAQFKQQEESTSRPYVCLDFQQKGY